MKRVDITPLFWALAAALVVKILHFSLVDPDVFWHLAAGREMLARRAFLREDVFSFTMLDTPWLNFEWLSQLIMLGFFKLGGAFGLIWMRIGLGLAALALLAVTLRRAGAAQGWVLVLTMLGFKAIQPRLLERPELATLIFMPLFIIGALRLRAAPSEWGKTGGALIIATAVWANLHGGFIYGIGLLGCFWLGLTWAGGAAGGFLKAAVGCFFASWLNPHGPFIYAVYLDHFRQHGGGASVIQEWAPTTFLNAPYFWAIFLTALVAAAIVVIKRRTALYFWVPAALIFGVWGAFLFRNAALATVVLLPFLGAFFKNAFDRPRLRKIGWGLAALALLWHARAGAKPWNIEPLLRTRFPVAAADFIQAENLQGRMYNNYGFGGYLIWALGPQRPTFMDGRYLFYGFLQDYNRNNQGTAQKPPWQCWEEYWARYQIDYAICDWDYTILRSLNPTTPFPLTSLNHMFPRETWALVYFDDAALIFARRGAGNDALIARQEYKALWPYNLAQMDALLQQKIVKPAEARREIERHKAGRGFTLATFNMEKIDGLLESRP